MSNEPLSTSATSTAAKTEETHPSTWGASWQSVWLGPGLEQNPWRVALLYLAVLSVAEALAVLVLPMVGIFLYFLLLFLLLLHATLTWERSIHRLFLSLALVPLIRIVSFSLPLLGFRLEYWYFFTSVPLFGAAYVVMRQLKMSWRQVGVTWRGWPLQVGLGLTGIGLGYIEYLILRPDPLASAFTWTAIWLPALILLISTGFLEEYIFRGIMQVTAVQQLGRLVGVSYVALFFAVLHVGYRSVTDFVFVLVVGLAFGFVVLKTQNLLGVTIAHGLTNIFLFLVFPFVIGNLQSPPPLAQGDPVNLIEPPVVVVTLSPTPGATPTAISSTVTPDVEVGKVGQGPLATTTHPSSTLAPTATFLPTPSPTSTDAPLPLTARATANNVFVRLGPDLSYPLWVLLPQEGSYPVKGQDESGNWLYLCCLLTAPDLGGWVARENLVLDGDLSQLAAIFYPSPQAQVAVTRLNARSGPGKDYPIITLLEMGSVYKIVGRDMSATWFNLCCLDSGETGWVFGESLLVWGVVEQIPVERIPLDEIVPTNEAQGSFWQKNALVLLLLLGSSGVMALLAFEPGSR